MTTTPTRQSHFIGLAVPAVEWSVVTQGLQLSAHALPGMAPSQTEQVEPFLLNVDFLNLL